ncbi:MAG: hypothetical protein GOVbin3762_27 [Prokaryotic dsDNA virus sp.]|nr:MAG: hypothetical protein GOVbin3762_27 [Prokaryotic dsDNA virus sp.]|tara:strand:+ start:8115 stop:8549 length:435 start_codon:yes stop_codon:yes gene_type:complete
MKNLNQIKERIQNYDYMTFSQYKELKDNILKLNQNQIVEIYSKYIDPIEELEQEVYYQVLESESETNSFYKRTKYFFKLSETIGTVVLDNYEKELDKPIEVQIQETPDNILLEMNKYEIGNLMTPKLKDLVIQELTKRNLMESA